MNGKKPTNGAAPYLIPISMGLLLQNDIYERLKFAYATAPRSTTRAFKKVGIIITSPQDLELIADLHRNGDDVAGFRGRNGQIYAFNVDEILKRPYNHPDSIRITKRMLANAPIHWTDIIWHQGAVKIINQP